MLIYVYNNKIYIVIGLPKRTENRINKPLKSDCISETTKLNPN